MTERLTDEQTITKSSAPKNRVWLIKTKNLILQLQAGSGGDQEELEAVHRLLQQRYHHRLTPRAQEPIYSKYMKCQGCIFSSWTRDALSLSWFFISIPEFKIGGGEININVTSSHLPSSISFSASDFPRIIIG